jgi:NAD+ diphosphatase
LFQDIEDHRLDNSYSPRVVRDTDFIISINNTEELLLLRHDGALTFPTFGALAQHFTVAPDSLCYLCSIDDHAFFQLPAQSTTRDLAQGALTYENFRTIMELEPTWLSFAAATALHVACWYRDNRFCGSCGHELIHSSTERALCCPACNRTIYPRINPVVIVGVTDGDRLLLTRYAHAAYRRYALVAGFVEIGETCEETVRREVLEEVGLRVKNIRYFKSQPWAFSESILAGFFAEVDGDKTIEVDTNELADAAWFERSKIPTDNSRLSLTGEMILSFKEGKI